MSFHTKGSLTHAQLSVFALVKPLWVVGSFSVYFIPHHPLQSSTFELKVRRKLPIHTVNGAFV